MIVNFASCDKSILQTVLIWLSSHDKQCMRSEVMKTVYQIIGGNLQVS